MIIMLFISQIEKKKFCKILIRKINLTINKYWQKTLTSYRKLELGPYGPRFFFIFHFPITHLPWIFLKRANSLTSWWWCFFWFCLGEEVCHTTTCGWTNRRADERSVTNHSTLIHSFIVLSKLKKLAQKIWIELKWTKLIEQWPDVKACRVVVYLFLSHSYTHTQTKMRTYARTKS